MRLAGTFSLVALSAVAGEALAAEDLLTKARQHFEPIPQQVPVIEDNAANPEKVQLGKMLFFEPRLSKSGLISCNSCHNISTGGADNLERSVGHRWQLGGRNAPTVLNAVYNIDQFWDGRADDLKTQATGPMQAGVEMASTPERVLGVLNSIPDYIAAFKAAFPDDRDPVSMQNAGRAIEVFEATLITPNAPFDRYLGGEEDALDDQQKRGLELFIAKNCVQCHNGKNIGGNTYRVFGEVQAPAPDVRPADDLGRFNVTKDEADKYAFRVAPLRNVALTAPYFHSGHVWDLAHAVKIMAQTQIGAELSDEEAGDIVAFLGSLTGQQPVVELPLLPPSTGDTPKPVLTE